MSKRTRLTQDQIDVKVSAVKEAVKKGSSITQACKDLGLPYNTFQRNKRKHKKTEKPEIVQIERPQGFSSADGKTLIIVTDDSRIIASVIDTFTRG